MFINGYYSYPNMTHSTAWSISTSSNTIMALFPPNSNVTFEIRFAAFDITWEPDATDPVKVYLSMRELLVNASPVITPLPNRLLTESC